MTRLPHILLLILMLFILCSNVSSFDFTTGRSDGMGGTVLLSDPSASVLVSAPSGWLPDKELRVEMTGTRHFDISALDQVNVSIAYRHGKVSGALGMSQIGQRDYYAERTLKLAFAYQKSEYGIGGTFSSEIVSFGLGYEALNASTVGINAFGKYKIIKGALVIDNLTSPSLNEGSPEVSPKMSLFTEIQGKESFVITARLTVEDREKPQFGIGQRLIVSEYGALFWGLSSEPTKYGFGFDGYYKDARLTYATSYHPSLGFSYTVTLAYQLGKKGVVADDEPSR